MRRLSLIAAAVALASTTVTSRAAGGWAQEPAAVLGARIGAPIEEIGLPACEGRPTSPCIETTVGGPAGMPTVRSIRGHPFDYAAISVQVDEAGVVTGIKVWMKSERFLEFRQALAARYGQPTTESSSSVQSQAGAIYESTTAVWVGKRLSIFAYERAQRIDESIVIFSDNAAAARAAEARTRRATGAASAL